MKPNGSIWTWLGPVLLAALMAIGGAAVQRVYSDRGLEQRVRAMEGQLREHGYILAGPNGVTVQLTEIRQVLADCDDRDRRLSSTRPHARAMTEAP